MKTEDTQVRERFDGQHGELTQRIIAAFYDVANELGHGFLESVYRRSMTIALEELGLGVQQEVPLPVFFRGKNVGTFHADLVVENLIVIELKTADEISEAHSAQLLHYLRSTRMEVGLVFAFGTRPKFKRAAMANERKPNLRAARSA